jgi:hypothetical protein
MGTGISRRPGPGANRTLFATNMSLKFAWFASLSNAQLSEKLPVFLADTQTREPLESPARIVRLLPRRRWKVIPGDGKVLAQGDLLIDKLIERLAYEDPITRRNAAGALRLHGDRAYPALPALEKLLDDPVPMVRNEARRAVERLSRCKVA